MTINIISSLKKNHNNKCLNYFYVISEHIILKRLYIVVLFRKAKLQYWSLKFILCAQLVLQV